MKIFFLRAILENFLLLKALKDSKIPYLFLADSKKCLAILFFVIKKMNQLNYHWKIIFLHLIEIWGKMELSAMNNSSFFKN